MQISPLVSVLMTAYNRENFLAEAIESVLASSLTDFELIIVDDCSTPSDRLGACVVLCVCSACIVHLP